MYIDRCLEEHEYRESVIPHIKKHLLFSYEETEITESALKRYRRKLDRQLKEMFKEIEAVRKYSLK